jgi:HK97 family phage prohead protease
MPDRKLAYARATLAGPPAKDGPLNFTASTERLNRYGFSLRHEGWRIDNFAANPLMLWMHNPMQPIGRADASLADRRLRAAATLDLADELGREIDRKYRAGFLNAVSVGFGFVKEDGSPIADWWRMSPEDIQTRAFYDLAEISAVSVPADPGALIDQRRQGLAWLSDELVELYLGRPREDTPPAWFEPALREALGRLGVDPAAVTPATDPIAPPAIDTAAAQALYAAFGPFTPKEATP